MALRWTSKPRVPVMVQAAATVGLALSVPACDSGGDGSTTDMFPTAPGPCSHGGEGPECDTATTTLGDGETTAPASTTDQFPTAGPCSHGGPGCGTTGGPETTGGSGSTSGSGSDSGGSDSGSGSGSGSTGGSTGGTTTG